MAAPGDSISSPKEGPARKEFIQSDKSLRTGLEISGVAGRHQVDFGGLQSILPASGDRRAVTSNAEQGAWETHTKGFGSRILGKYGFKDRLGATGQGISQPVESCSTAGRAGLGASTARDGHEDHCVAEGFGETIAKFQAKEGSRPVKVSRKSNVLKRKRCVLQEMNADEKVPVTFDAYGARRNGRGEAGKSIAQDMCIRRVHEPQPSNQIGPVSGDDDDLEECDEEVERIFDSGRRGILVDFDSLVKDSFGRRVEAFTVGVRGFDGIPLDFDVKPLLECDGKDLGDENAVRSILDSNDLDVTDEQCDALLNRIDDAFDALRVPVREENLLAALKAASQKCHIGVLHRGSKRRLNSELKRMNLSNTFNTRKMVLHFSDTFPYTRSWNELLCRLGVTARQSVFVVSDCNMNPTSSFAIAGHILGARVMVRVDALSGESVRDPSALADLFDATIVTTCDSTLDAELSFLTLLRIQAPVQRRRRVLSVYGVEGLWYAGRVEYRCRLKDHADDKLLVRYYRWDNLEWVYPADALPLSKRGYKIMESHQFCGIVEPGTSIM